MAYRVAVIKHGESLQLVDADGKVLLKRVNGDIERQLRATLLHELDLQFCRACLHQLELLDYNTQSHLAEAYWISCITRFFKCFGQSEARPRLSASKIFRTISTADFEYFRALRNKHIVHDENPFSDVLVTVAVNASPGEPSFAGVFGSPIHRFTIEGDLNRLRNLVVAALDFVTQELRAPEQQLATTYSQWSREKLLALPDLVVSPPRESDVSLTRQ